MKDQHFNSFRKHRDSQTLQDHIDLINDSLLASKGSSNQSSEQSVQSNLSEIENLYRESEKLSMSRAERDYQQFCQSAKSQQRSNGNPRYQRPTETPDFETPSKERKPSRQNVNESKGKFRNENQNRNAKLERLDINETLKIGDLGISTGRDILPNIKTQRENRFVDFDERQINDRDFDFRHQGIQISSNSARRRLRNEQGKIDSFQKVQRRSCNRAQNQTFERNFEIKHEKGHSDIKKEDLAEFNPKKCINQHQHFAHKQDHSRNFNKMNRWERNLALGNFPDAQREKTEQWSSENKRNYRTGDEYQNEKVILLKSNSGIKIIQSSQSIQHQNQRNPGTLFEDQITLQPQHQNMQFESHTHPRKRKNSQFHLEISQKIEDEDRSNDMHSINPKLSSLEGVKKYLSSPINLFVRFHNWLGSFAPLLYAGLIIILIVAPFKHADLNSQSTPR